jgi:antitoxin ParD1/3/4
MSIQLSERAMKLAQEGAATAGAASVSEYLESLILAEDRREATRKWLDDELTKGEESGEAIPVTEEWWERKRAAFIERHQNRKRESA